MQTERQRRSDGLYNLLIIHPDGRRQKIYDLYPYQCKTIEDALNNRRPSIHISPTATVDSQLSKNINIQTLIESTKKGKYVHFSTEYFGPIP